MEYESGRPCQYTDDQRHRAGENQKQHGIAYSIWPGTAVPPTVLVADMGGGSLFFEGRRDRPSAYLNASDAMPLWCELTRAFSSTDLPSSSGQGETL